MKEQTQYKKKGSDKQTVGDKNSSFTITSNENAKFDINKRIRQNNTISPRLFTSSLERYL